MTNLSDTDDDNYRPSKRLRVDFRPPAVSRSYDDIDGLQSSPGRAHSWDDVPMTDNIDNYLDELWSTSRINLSLMDSCLQDEDDHQANKCSLEIDYKQFISVHPNIAIWLADAPQSVLEVMENVARSVIFSLHPNYKNIHKNIYIRITNLPVYDQIWNIRQIHLNTMIRFRGVVTRRSGVFPHLQQLLMQRLRSPTEKRHGSQSSKFRCRNEELRKMVLVFQMQYLNYSFLYNHFCWEKGRGTSNDQGSTLEKEDENATSSTATAPPKRSTKKKN
ncbi:hypothetical protein SLEP1_g54090 [Rubroshorea leprosula]|uniref:MCM N-terminal domain-containing protein n=1 Tax=Rubroshorea leprosula TaxID=152421 RepID=A0AAV5MFB7_9ROSI|nr:hypothetical protein SLEP1_g54090 [Rubroshorea leprosula]